MTPQNLFWSSNLKHLRNRQKISQEDLAAVLSITRSKLAAHESGKTQNPPIEDLVRFSGYYKISIDSLLKVDLTKMGELKLRELQAGNDVYMSGSNIRVLAITVDKNNKENVEYVPKKAQAGYRDGFNDPEFIGSLPKFSLPNLSAKRTYRIFPTEGASMSPFPEGCSVVTEYVANWKEMEEGQLCIVILKAEQQFLFKTVYQQIEDKGSFLLRSLNPMFSDQEVLASDVLEFWKYHSHLTSEVPTPLTDIQQLALQLAEVKLTVGEILSLGMKNKKH